MPRLQAEPQVGAVQPWLVDSAVDAVVSRRVTARRTGDFQESDRLRLGLAKLGIFVLDTSHDEGFGRIIETRLALSSDCGDRWLRAPPAWEQPVGGCKNWRHKRRAYCGSPVVTSPSAPAAIWSTLQQTKSSVDANDRRAECLDISQLHYCADCIARNQLTGRCPCPFDPRHSVLLTKLSGHLRLCQSKPGVSAASSKNCTVVPRSGGGDAQVPGINAVGERSHEDWQGSVLLSPEADPHEVNAATSDLGVLVALAERMAAAVDAAEAQLQTEAAREPERDQGREQPPAQQGYNDGGCARIEHLHRLQPPLPFECFTKRRCGCVAGESEFCLSTENRHVAQNVSIARHLCALGAMSAAGPSAACAELDEGTSREADSKMYECCLCIATVELD